MSEINHQQRRDELAAYLLGALDAGEIAALEQHLAGCEECRDELERLRPVVQALPESVERVEPAAALRTRVMSEVRADAAQARPRRRPILLRPAVGVAALILIAAAVTAFTLGGDSDSGRDATTVVAGKPPGVTARMVSEGDAGTLHLANLRDLPPGEGLQAWVQRGEQVERSGPLFTPDRDGTATTVIADMAGVNTVMVTAEPRGGSPVPTSEPLVSIDVQ